MAGGGGDRRAAAKFRSVEALVALCLLGGLGIRLRLARGAGGATTLEATSRSGAQGASSSSSSAGDLAFVVSTRGYAAVSPEVAALYGTWSHVVEPLREATFEAVGADAGSSLSWRVAKLAGRSRRRLAEAAAAEAGAAPAFSRRTWAPFDASHEWDEVKESVTTFEGDAATLTCAQVHDRYRVTLVEVLSSSGGAHGSNEREAVENVEPWMNVDAEDGRAAKQSSRRRRVVSSDAVVCKYVRRELRSLTDDDRERYLGALAAVHRVGAADGAKVYGSKFRSQKAFLLKHLGEDTVKGCSVFHGADAFLTGHAAFTLELEQALQSVDASIAAPYWDTSVDDAARGSAWADGLELFDEAWLGARDGAGGAALDYPALTTGRFAYVEIPTVSTQDSGGAKSPPERNAFGRLTQSYNNDPARFLWRSSSVCGLPSKLRLPGCDALRGVLKKRSLSDLRAKIETDWHGALHPTLGGAFDCGSESSGASALRGLSTTAPELVQFVHQLAEVLWDVAHAAGYAKCPEACDETGGFDACRCACPAVDAAFAAGNATAAYAFLDDLGLLSRYAGSQRGDVFVFADDESGAFCFAATPNGACLEGAAADAFFVALAQLACAPGRVSPYMTPLAASNDPLFWVTHASFEKLWAFKRLTDAAPNTADDEADAHALDDADDGAGALRRARPAKQAASDALVALDIIAPDADDAGAFDESWDWHNASGSPKTVGSYCLGKAWHDPTPFANFLGETDDAFYTNADLYALFDPTNARLPYVFDDMAWAHCRTDAAAAPDDDDDDLVGR